MNLPHGCRSAARWEKNSMQMILRMIFTVSRPLIKHVYGKKELKSCRIAVICSDTARLALRRCSTDRFCHVSPVTIRISNGHTARRNDARSRYFTYEPCFLSRSIENVAQQTRVDGPRISSHRGNLFHSSLASSFLHTAMRIGLLAPIIAPRFRKSALSD